MGYADAEQEPAWPLPLEPWHRQQCPSHYADTANSRPVPGGGPVVPPTRRASSPASSPMRGRAGCVDLAACFSENGDNLWAPGANTQGMRTIAHTLLAEVR